MVSYRKHHIKTQKKHTLYGKYHKTGEKTMNKILLTNYAKEWELHILACLKYSGLNYEISEEAYDFNGNLLPTHKSIFIIPDDKKENLFFDMSIRLSRSYQRLLVNSGFCSLEETLNKNIYLGCEEEYWPDRDVCVLQEAAWKLG